MRQTGWTFSRALVPLGRVNQISEVLMTSANLTTAIGYGSAWPTLGSAVPLEMGLGCITEVAE